MFGGGDLTEEAKGLIKGVDALVALLSRRDPLPTGGWTIHDWVKFELDFARNINKRAIALVEQEGQLSSG